MSVYCGDGEPVDVYDENVHRARKEWKCDACKETIRRGDRYHRTKVLFDGEWEVTVRCARCEAMFRFLQPVVRKRSHGDECCAEALDCGHAWEEYSEEPPPLAVQALAFLTADEAQKLLSGPLNTQHESVEERIAQLLRQP